MRAVYVLALLVCGSMAAPTDNNVPEDRIVNRDDDEYPARATQEEPHVLHVEETDDGSVVVVLEKEGEIDVEVVRKPDVLPVFPSVDLGSYGGNPDNNQGGYGGNGEPTHNNQGGYDGKPDPVSNNQGGYGGNPGPIIDDNQGGYAGNPDPITNNNQGGYDGIPDRIINNNQGGYPDPDNNHAQTGDKYPNNVPPPTDGPIYFPRNETGPWHPTVRSTPADKWSWAPFPDAPRPHPHSQRQPLPDITTAAPPHPTTEEFHLPPAHARTNKPRPVPGY